MDTQAQIKAPEAPTENTVGQHTYFISKSTELDKALHEAKSRGFKVLGWERTKTPVKPDRNAQFAHTVKQERFVLKCMAPRILKNAPMFLGNVDEE